MELVLQGFNSNNELSVEECVRRAVEGMCPENRLETALEVVGIGLEQEERTQEVVAETWALILREGWWKVRYRSLDEFMANCGISEGAKEAISRRMRTERLKRNFELSIQSRWQGRELKEILGEGLMPTQPGKAFLEAMNVLARQVEEAEEAVELLRAARDDRLKTRQASNDPRLRLGDVKAAIKNADSRPPRRSQITVAGSQFTSSQFTAVGGSQMAASQITEIDESPEPELAVRRGSKRRLVVESESEEESEMRRKNGWTCYCEDERLAWAAGQVLAGFKGKGLIDKMAELEAIDGEMWQRLCYPHVKLLASGLELQTLGLDRDKLVERLEHLQRNADEMDTMTQERGTYEWFRKTGRPAHEDDNLGPFKYPCSAQEEFRLDVKVIWERYGGEGAMEKFYEGGNVVVRGALDWIVKDEEVMGMVDAEFEMYRHHLREQNGVSNYGWCRNMWHSLVQQVIRQDPVLYALNVAARPDLNWRLVSFPYYTKYASPGDSTKFKHIDINVRRYLTRGRGGSTVQTGISMDDESEDGCTIVVPGFHRRIGQWWQEVERRGKVTDGLVQDVKNIYMKEDEERFGGWAPVVCKRGDIRLTLANMIHGSTGPCMRVRRVIHPWLVGINPDNGELDFSEAGSYEDVCSANRKMEAMQTGPTGDRTRFSVGEGRFVGSVQMRGMSALGDALVGAQEWTSKEVLRERDLILGQDSKKAREYVDGVRSKMVEKWKECFKVMVEAEVEEYGENAYFRGVDMLCSMASAHE